jgi:hypothetical protein
MITESKGGSDFFKLRECTLNSAFSTAHPRPQPWQVTGLDNHTSGFKILNFRFQGHFTRYILRFAQEGGEL